MSYTYLLAEGGVSSAESFWDIPASVLLNMTNTQDQSCLPDRKMDACQDSQSGMISKPLMGNLGQEELMLSVVDFPVKTFPVQERVQESQESNQGYGNIWRELLMKYDQDMSLLKTHLCLWEEVLQVSSVILPAWGMMQDGVFLERMILVDSISGKGAGYWPTPLKNEGPGSQHMKLTDAVAIQEGYKPRYYQLTGMEGREAFTGKVNPNWVEWLMGWPVGWTDDLHELGMDKFLLWQQQHGRY